MVRVQEIPLNQIRQPLPRQTDAQKVPALMVSIAEIGQQEPIDVLEVDGEYYGFSGFDTPLPKGVRASVSPERGFLIPRVHLS
ncbi:MAG TPA: ParB N-terminal domain-containing protein [Nostocaceae cyanobacterium]|nr:ParB N-terminal domain-containing protein [Nostocaceae cyanobacterium]